MLVRHGATVAEPGRCIGHTDVELSDEGRRAMTGLAAGWDTIDYAHAMILDIDCDGRARALAINVDRIN